MTGQYDSNHLVITWISLLLNIMSLALALDFVYRAEVLNLGSDVSFSRVGFVDHVSARVIIRHPETSQIFYQISGSSAWDSGPTVPSLPSQDFVSLFYLDSLQPATTYHYRTNTSHSGHFTTALIHPKRLTIATSSCIKPNFPYNPLASPLHIPGLAHLSTYASYTPIDMMLFLGDFIYIDLPTRFGFTTSHYRAAYRQVYASPNWTPTLRAMPWLHMYDDHEITNDWASNETGLWSAAMEPYYHYQQIGNPASLIEEDGGKGTYYTFRKGDVSFFVLDTRRYRSVEEMKDGDGKTMLGGVQRQKLEAWLEEEKGWKVVVSSVPFTRNWRGPESIDSWAGYLWERQRILEKMWAVKGVIILSGVGPSPFTLCHFLLFLNSDTHVQTHTISNRAR